MFILQVKLSYGIKIVFLPLIELYTFMFIVPTREKKKHKEQDIHADVGEGIQSIKYRRNKS